MVRLARRTQLAICTQSCFSTDITSTGSMPFLSKGGQYGSILDCHNNKRRNLHDGFQHYQRNDSSMNTKLMTYSKMQLQLKILA